ncbi:MAG: anti-sigma factor [Candidatus Dormibacteraeota bacterium]|nr:anti-sigma factor [Candidatus Dormibacteraeota bacterium]
MTPNHDSLEEMVAAYTLGALEPEEQESVRAHIEACASCRQLLNRLSTAAATIPLAVAEVRPPSRLRAQILSAAAATSPGERAERGPSRVLPLKRPRTGRRSFQPRWQWPSWASNAAVAVLAVGLLGLGAWNVNLQQQLSRPPTSHQILGQGEMAGSQATVTTVSQDRLALVSFEKMPQAPEGKVYELWLIGDDGRPAPAGVFTPDQRGTYTLVVNRDVRGVRKVAVTVEAGPDGTSAPTQTSQLAGSIS